VNLPKEIIEQVQWKKGDPISVETIESSDNEIIIILRKKE